MRQPAPKKPERGELPPPLKTTQEVRAHIEKNRALKAQAEREREDNEVHSGQIDNEQKSFALRREMIYLGVELTVIAVVLGVILYLLLSDHLEPAVYLLGGSGLSGGLYIWRRSKTDS
jgi:hypothetical protein